MEAMAVLEKQQQFDFQNNGIEVMNFETLQRTYKENDIYGKPVQGIYHYQVLQRMMDICEKYNLDYEVEEIFAAQNRNKTQPGVSILPQVEQTLGEKAVEAHILRRIFATIRIKDWETDELTTTLVVAYHQDGIQAAIGPCVKVCHNQCILSPERSICNYGKNKVTTEGVFETVERLIAVALPRIRDFKGINEKFDGQGNYTLGITEQIIFPEIDIDKITKIFGMEITFVTTAKTDEEAYALLREFGLPFKNAKKNQ